MGLFAWFRALMNPPEDDPCHSLVVPEKILEFEPASTPPPAPPHQPAAPPPAPPPDPPMATLAPFEQEAVCPACGRAVAAKATGKPACPYCDAAILDARPGDVKPVLPGPSRAGQPTRRRAGPPSRPSGQLELPNLHSDG